MVHLCQNVITHGKFDVVIACMACVEFTAFTANNAHTRRA